MNRRTVLRSGALALASTTGLAPWIRALAAAGLRFKHSICNEVFEKWDFARSCKEIRAAGFDGIEIAPFTLAESADELSPARRRELGGIIRSEGLRFAGLHWILLTPKWLHVTTADRAIREKSWAYFLKLIDLCADLGDRGIMVLGSPKQRASQGNSRAEATKHLKEGLASVAPHAGERRVVIALEALASKDTDVVNTVDEAARIAAEINHPAIQTMFDFHNTADERQPLDAIVRRHFARIRHVHVNEMDGRYPGTGNLDFRPVFQVLADLKYAHWVSLEVFDFKPGPVEIARSSMDFFRKLEGRLRS
ncbi:MAG: sugar phosphate isomerase/epimerase [Acidobacteria bacterium]|nr:MAG: sugar phosphate isomerase/epimerase [Acidobacteriota bacterium]